MQASDATASVLLDADAPSLAPHRMHGGVVRIVCFFAFVVVLAWAFDAFIDLSLRRLSTGDYGEWNRIVQGRINADLLISGSSRALTHYDTRILTRATGRTAYNIGLNGSQTDMQLARLKTYLQHNRKPALIILNLDAFSFRVSHGEVYDPGQYIPYLDQPDLFQALATISADTWKARFIPLYGYAAQDLRFSWFQALRYWLDPAPQPTHADGFKARHASWTGEFDDFRARHPSGVRIEIEPAGVAQVEELLRLCRSHGIHVVLVYSPEYSEMQAMTNNRGEIFARFDALSREHGAALLDFSVSPISSRTDLFYNSQHLNAEGAEAFTHELAQRLPAIMKSAFTAEPQRHVDRER